MMEAKEKAKSIARALEDKKAQEIRLLQVEQLTQLTEMMVIASASSSTQLSAMADEVGKALDEAGDPLLRTEGAPGCGWVLLDCGSVIVHLFQQEKRQFYQMERLWADAIPVQLTDAPEA